MDPGAQKTHPELILRPPVVSFKLFAVGAHIHKEDSGVQGLFAMLLGDHRLLDGVHAAHRGTVTVVAVVQVPGAHALEPGNLLGLFLVRRPDHVALEGPGRGQDPLKLHAGDDVGEGAVMVGLVAGGVKGLEAHRQNDGPYGDILVQVLLGEIHRPGGAKFFAGFAFAALLEINAGVFVYGILGGHRLGIAQVSRFTLGQAQVVFIGHFLRAFLGAQAAGNALGHIDIARHLAHLDREITRLAADADDLGRGHDLDVNMPADLDQLGRDNSHGAVIGGEGLVQLRHNPANGRFLLHQVNKISGIGQIQSRLHPGDAAADNHHCPNRLIALLLWAHKDSPVISVGNSLYNIKS